MKGIGSRWVVAVVAVVVVVVVVVAAAACSSPTDTTVEGTWGGPDASMVLSASGGRVSYACGYGTIDPGWSLSRDGAFTARGAHFFGGGPEPESGRVPHPARYSGALRGDVLTLEASVLGDSVRIGPFELHRGGPEVTEICD